MTEELKYGRCRTIIAVEEKNEEGFWKPICEFTSWRAEAALNALCGLLRRNKPDKLNNSPILEGVVKITKILDGTQRVLIGVIKADEPGELADSVMWQQRRGGNTSLEMMF